MPSVCSHPPKLFIHEYVRLGPLSKFIMNDVPNKGVFVAKKYCSIGAGLTVVTANHATSNAQIGKWFTKDSKEGVGDIDRDVVLGEDCWIGSNVTLLPGVEIGRGAIVGSGSVVRSSVPPYSIVIGNPAKIVGFKFSVEEIIEHEKMLFLPEERIMEEVLKKNYEKYFLKRIEEIKLYTRIKC